MDEVDIKYEEEYLELVKQYIVDYREKLSHDFHDVAHMYKGRYNQVKWGDEDLVSNQQQMIENKRKKLIDLEYKPYFGKFIFRDSKKHTDDIVYIGKTSITDSSGETLVTDWRAPVCSLFYEQRFGRTFYESPSGKIWCEMLKKYLIQIEEGELLDVVDTSLISNDEILASFLAVSNETRLKNIIASIQAEQNEIIRRPLNTNMIVQGVAGSGKTTVALHRAAYLLYQNDNYTSNDFIIFGPNKYFLNYISLLLPDLDTENINQFTYEDFTKYYFDGKIKIFDTKEIHDERILKILKFKSSMEFKRMIDKFVEDYIEKVLSKDIMLKDNVLFSKEFIKNSIRKDDLSNSIKSVQKFLISKVKEDSEYYSDMFLHPYRIALKQIDSNNLHMTEIISDMNFIKENLKKNCSTIISNYFKPLKLKPNELYKKFIDSIEGVPGFTCEEVSLLKEMTLLSIKKRTFGYEELPALLYLNTIFHDSTNDVFNHYRHVIVDEGQDLGEFHYYMLKKIFGNSTFSIFGDIAQSIYPGRGIDNWHNVGEVMEFNNLEYLFLTKSYRTTTEITNNANRILNYLNIPTSNPVLRSGNDIDYFKVDDSKEEIELIKILLEDYYEKQYKSFGIICKDHLECQKKHKMLKKNGIDINLVSGSDEKYVSGISILPAELSKGLEFDQVLLTNVDVDSYDDFNTTDMKLLYVAATRALHELTISYQKELVAPFREERQKKLKKVI